MGNCHNTEATDVVQCTTKKPVEIITMQHFEFMYCIGRGGFGKVWKVRFKKNQTIFAMKVMEKAKIMSRRSLNSVMAER
jgi:serine/threonine protein kinase